MQMVSFFIDGIDIKAEKGETILSAAINNQIYIPHLCHHPSLPDIGACQLCVVVIQETGAIQNACLTEVEEGMHVLSKTDELNHIRQIAMGLMLSNHIDDCLDCPKYLRCEFQSLIQYMGSGTFNLRSSFRPKLVNTSSPLMIRDMSRCVSCGRCVRVCEQVRGVGVLTYEKDEVFKSGIMTKGKLPLEETDCRFCGACVEVCPTGALRDKEGVFKENFAKGELLIPCKTECPASTDVYKYVRYCNQGNWEQALATLREKLPFPGSLGEVCMRFCESACKRRELGGAISIRELKKMAVAKGGQVWKENLKVKPDTGKTVAIVGGGPAGLTAAWFLRLGGHAVDVFEKNLEAGGMLRYGIPEYRLSKELVQGEIREIKDIGVNIMTETEIVDNSRLNAYDATIYAIGACKGQRLPIPGADADGVLENIEFLKSVRAGTRHSIEGDVFVIGGGNVAFDCARTAVRLGANSVTLACLESRENMTADKEEVESAEEEGIIVFNSRTFDAITTENGRATGVQFSKISTFAFDENHRLKLTLEPESQICTPCNTVIFAVGQKSVVPEEMGLTQTPKSTVVTDDNLQTSHEGVFAAGDVVTGTASVVGAVAQGRKAAEAVDRYLGGDGQLIIPLAQEQSVDPWIGVKPGFSDLIRNECKDEDCAKAEADRCLQCDLRTLIIHSKFQSEYDIR